jgi:hypothetical protein
VLLTQNVDGLHQRAGSRNVIDLHGRLDLVRCMGCERRSGREDFQQRLLDANPGWDALEAGIAPMATPTWRPISPASWCPIARTAAAC